MDFLTKVHFFADLLQNAGLQRSPAPAQTSHKPADILEQAGIVPVMTIPVNRLLVPAFGFKSLEAAAHYIQSVSTIHSDGKRERTIIRTRDTVYVERDVSLPEFTIDLKPLDFVRRNDGRYRQPWLTLRDRDVPMPKGAYHVLLLPEGRRTTRLSGGRERAVPWVKEARGGPWEMAVAWERGDGERLADVYEDRDIRIFAARRVRGVYIARRAEITGAGLIERFVTEVGLLKLQVLDKGRGDDVVEPEIRVTRWVDDMPVMPDRYEDRIINDPRARRLFAKAASLFADRCEDGLPKDIERRLSFFQKQNAMVDGQQGWDFRLKIDDIGDMAALDLCKEPWQLAIVVSRYGFNPNYASNQMSYTMGECTCRMLAKYKSTKTETRRDLVDRWMTDYVFMTTDMWNYTGD